MANFVLIDKKSLNEISVDTSNINLTAPSSVHTKLYRNEVSEFIQDGNNLILKLKNGKTIVVKNFFIVKGELESELVFEDTTGMPWLPYLLGGAAAAGAIAALASDSDGDNTTQNTPPSVVTGKEKQPTITGENKPKTGNITDVKDPDGDQLTYKVTTQPKNGTVIIDAKTGEYTYTPNKDFNGDDTFTVTVDDGKGGTTTIEVPVSVVPAATVSVEGYEDNLGVIPENVDSGKSTRDNKPVISGIAKNSKIVEVTITDAQGKVVTTLTVNVDKDGKWVTPELPTSLKDGDYTITAKAKDALGNEVASKEYTVTVDTTVDAGNPEIVTDLDGDSTITTTVDPKDVTKVEVIDPTTKQPIPGLVVKGPDPMTGEVVIEGKIPTGVDPELKVTDGAGNENQVLITDKTPAATVSVDGYEDNVDGQGNVTTPENITTGGFTNDNTPKISGTSTGAKTVEVFIDGKSVGTATVGQDGKWSLPESAITTPLADGPHTITAKATNGAGDTVTSTDYTVTVDTKVDAGNPEIVTDLDGDSTITTTVDPKDVTKVEVIDPTTKQPIPGLVVKGPDPMTGEVVIEGKIPTGVDPELKVTDGAGNENQVLITDKTPAATVSVDGYEDNVGSIQGNVESKESTDDNKPVISGKSSGASTVEVTIKDVNGNVVETIQATVDSKGNWTTPELTTALKDGDYTITAKATNGAGKEVSSNEYTVTVDTTVDAGMPEIITSTDGDSTITTTVDPKDVTKVEVIDPTTKQPIPGLVVKGPDPMTGEVVIEGKIPTGVDPELKVTDGAGNENQVLITDKTPAATVSVDGYEDNVDGQGNVTTPENITTGGFTNDNTPKISGTSTGAKTVEVFIDGKSVGTATVGQDGKWSLPESAITTPLADGPHTITAKATNGAGDTVTSTDYTVTVDTTVDAGKPHIEIDKDGNATITTTVDPEDIDNTGIKVIDPKTGIPIDGVTVVGPNDKGQVTITGKIPDGVVPELVVTDKAGNTTKVPTPFILEDEKFDGKIVAGGSTGSYSLSNTAAILDPKTGKYTLSTANGTVILDSTTGEYTYTPNKDFSGSDTFTVSVSDANGTKEIIVPIFVTAVADTPLVTESMEFNVGELALNKYVWKNINGKMTIGGKEYDFNGKAPGGNGNGSGINPTTLVDGINALLANKDKNGERKPFVEEQTTALKDPDIKAGDAVLINGLVYLEEGKTYTYKGQADDSGMIIIGNGLSSQYVSWSGPTGGQQSSIFTVEKTGFYDFNLYVHNESNVGNFDFKVTEENGTDVKYYPSAEAIQKELPGFIQLGDKDTINGFYDTKFGYAGYETDKIKLEKIHAKLADVDGSETLTVTLSNLPAGTKLTVTSVDNQGNEVLVEVTADSNGQVILTGKDNVVEFKDFELELPKDAKIGTETINVEVTATEKSHGDSKSDSFDFEVTVKDPVDLIATMKVETAGNGDDDIAGIDGSHNVLVGDQGGVQTNFVAGHDYNVAVVLDVSGSMQWNMTYDDKSTPVRMDVAREGLKLFVKEMVNHQGDINLTLITFENASKNLGTFVVNQNNLNDILKTIDGIQAGGGTEPGVGFDEATKWFNKQTNGSENQTYFITDGDPNTVWANLNPRRGEKYISEEEAARQNEVLWKERDANFKPLADTSKVFGVGLGEVKLDNVQRYDNTDVDGNKINDWDSSKRGSSQVLHDKDTLVSYLIGGSENFKPAEAGNDKVTGGNGNDILFGDAINTNHLQWDGRDSVKHPQYSGYSTLIDYLKATVTGGAEPTEQQIYKYLQENYMDFVKADANDPNVKGGNDIIDGGAGNDIIIAGAGNDLVIASQGNDIISTGPGNDTLLYKLLSGLEAENTGGHGVDTWVDFALGNPATNDNADVLKFSEDFFVGLKMEDLISSETVGKFITVDYDEASQTATISVDRDGESSGYTAETLLHLTHQDKEITLDDLLANNQIVIG